jgi:NADP-dependent 3-hydroxy acid dehydrogenase YdfG
VEIFGKLSSELQFSSPENLKLRDLNTIGKLADWIQKNGQSLEPSPEIPGDKNPKLDVSETIAENSNIKRFVVKARKKEGSGIKENRFKGKTFIVTMDHYGFADDIIQRIQFMGGKAISMGDSPNSVFQIIGKNPSEVEKQVADYLSAQASMQIDGILHIAPVDLFFNRFIAQKHFLSFLFDTKKEFKASHRHMDTLFILIKLLQRQLNRPKTFIASIGFNSVVFPYHQSLIQEIIPEFAGISGMLKTINKELIHTSVKMVDFLVEDKGKTPAELINGIVPQFINELNSHNKEVEVGYKNEERYCLSLINQAVKHERNVLKDGDTILITGGAGGITFEILKKLLQYKKLNLIIFGRSEIRDFDKSWMAYANDEKKVMAKLKLSMKNATPLAMRNKARQILRTVNTILNLEKLKSYGFKVAYKCVDVRDLKTVKKAVGKYKKIDGIIHAAGIEESAMIENKQYDSFKRVVDVKVVGCRNLFIALDKKKYNYFSVFSSVTARLGNEGQIDYTGANDMLGKMIQNEKLKNPGKVYKIFSWTAWKGAGMATKETTQKVLESRGVSLLPLEEGINFFLKELGNQSDSEVVIAGNDAGSENDRLLYDIDQLKVDNAFPMLGEMIKDHKEHKEFGRVLDIEHDLFLLDHAMEGTPIFLGATGIETMAEAAACTFVNEKLQETRQLKEVKNFSIPYGIKLLKKRPKKILIESTKTGEDSYTCRIESLYQAPGGRTTPKLHYKGDFIFGSGLVAYPHKIELPAESKVFCDGSFRDLVYHPRRLFMEDLFKSVEALISFDGETLVTKICDRSTAEFFKDIANPDFQSDVVFTDAMFQTGGIFEFLYTDNLVLPYEIRSMKFFKRAQKFCDYYCITKRTSENAETVTFEIDLIDEEGGLLIRVAGFEMVKLGKIDEKDRIRDKFRISENQAV